MKLSLLFFFLISCAQWTPTNRSQYILLKQDDFLISNIYVNPTDIDKNDKGIRFSYIIVVKNLSSVERKLNFEEASITIGLRKLPIACLSHENKKNQTKIKPEETLTIECEINLNKEEGMFQVGDYKSLIEIPLDQSKAYFAYLLRAEDFK